MKILFILFSFFLLGACVPAKKYNDLLEREKKCSEELETYKTSSLDNEGKAKDLQARYDVMKKEVTALKIDTSNLGNNYRLLQTQYDKMVIQNEALETVFDKLRLAGAKEAGLLQAELEGKNLELQRKEDALTALEMDLKNEVHIQFVQMKFY